MFTALLTILFGPIGFLFGMGNWRANRRNKKLMRQMDYIDRRRMRLENPVAYNQLQKEDWQKAIAACLIGSIILLFVFLSIGTNHPSSKVVHGPVNVTLFFDSKTGHYSTKPINPHSLEQRFTKEQADEILQKQK